MKILYMGTAAYDAIPSPFCTCETCRKAFKLGGKDYRTRTQTLINDDLLIDFNADSVSHFLKYRIDTTKIKSCLITHSHSDHLYPEDIVIPQYASHSVTVDYFSAEDGYNKIMDAIKHSDAPENAAKYVKVTKIEEGQTFMTNGYKVLALPANHDPSSSPVFYAIEKDNKRVLYAQDTGVFFDRAFDMLGKFGRFDLITLDCTAGLLKEGEWRNSHMKFERNLEVIARLKDMKVVDDKTIIVLNHFCHNSFNLHSELVEAASKYGIIISYDGMEIEF